jgi:pentatricopeptide repeat protein
MFTCNCMIDGFSKQGDVDQALQFFREMKQKEVIPNGVTYNMLIDGLAKHGEEDRALQLLEEMKQSGLENCVKHNDEVLKTHNQKT